MGYLLLFVHYLLISFRVTSGSGLAATRQAWIDVKAWLNDGRDKAAILAEIHRSEAHLMQQYAIILQEPK